MTDTQPTSDELTIEIDDQECCRMGEFIHVGSLVLDENEARQLRDWLNKVLSP